MALRTHVGELIESAFAARNYKLNFFDEDADEIYLSDEDQSN